MKETRRRWSGNERHCNRGEMYRKFYGFGDLAAVPALRAGRGKGMVEK